MREGENTQKVDGVANGDGSFYDYVKNLLFPTLAGDIKRFLQLVDLQMADHFPLPQVPSALRGSPPRITLSMSETDPRYSLPPTSSEVSGPSDRLGTLQDLGTAPGLGVSANDDPWTPLRAAGPPPPASAYPSSTQAVRSVISMDTAHDGTEGRQSSYVPSW